MSNPTPPGPQPAIRVTAMPAVACSSVKIATEAWQRDRESERTAKVTEASFTFVAIDELGKPRQVPPDKTP